MRDLVMRHELAEQAAGQLQLAVMARLDVGGGMQLALPRRPSRSASANLLADEISDAEQAFDSRAATAPDQPHSAAWRSRWPPPTAGSCDCVRCRKNRVPGEFEAPRDYSDRHAMHEAKLDHMALACGANLALRSRLSHTLPNLQNLAAR